MVPAVMMLFAMMVQAQQPTPAVNASNARGQVPACVSGAVKDVGGTPVSDANLKLSGPAGFTRSATTDEDGEFEMEGLPPGSYLLTVSAEGLTGSSAAVTLAPGEQKQMPPFALRIAMTNFQVDAISQAEMADEQLHAEEQQRLFGVLPNYYVVYDRHPVPLTSRQKLKLALHAITDPVTFGTTALSAGIQQMQGTFAGYGPGFGGYSKRYGADYADAAIGTMLGGVVYASWFKQDPRYFYKGTGSVWSRARYALSTAVIARGDNGKWQPAYASVLGDFSAGAISNIYYPASDRNGARLTLENGLLSVASDGVGNLLQEFLLKHITTKTPRLTPP